MSTCNAPDQVCEACHCRYITDELSLCHQVTSWFWDILSSCSKELRSAVLQWGTGLLYLPSQSSSKFEIRRDHAIVLPIAQHFGGMLGRITLPSSGSKEELKDKLVRVCKDAELFYD
jgi:hypothetical protein